MKLSEIYFGAIDVIRERGWCQGDYSLRDGSVCMYGAMRVAAGHSPYLSTSDTLDCVKHFRQSVFQRLQITDANDKHCKTADDACAFLEIAACCAAAEGK